MRKKTDWTQYYKDERARQESFADHEREAQRLLVEKLTVVGDLILDALKHGMRTHVIGDASQQHLTTAYAEVAAVRCLWEAWVDRNKEMA